jgi:hypothetical protein
MAVTKTLAQLRTALLRRAGFDTGTTSADLTPDVLNELINDALFEGHDVMTAKWLDYYTTSTAVPLVAGTDTYSLPTTFYKLRAVWMANGAEAINLDPIDLDAAHLYVGRSVGSIGDYRYRMMGRNLIIAPVPASAETLTIYFIPLQPTLVDDSDSITFDVPIELKFILSIAWRDILDRQNLDPSPAIAKMQAYEAKLRTAADARDARHPFYLDARGPRGSTLDDDGDF